VNRRRDPPVHRVVRISLLVVSVAVVAAWLVAAWAYAAVVSIDGGENGLGSLGIAVLGAAAVGVTAHFAMRRQWRAAALLLGAAVVVFGVWLNVTGA
jgi:hypothetical protein